jgi:hypothetical protein
LWELLSKNKMEAKVMSNLFESSTIPPKNIEFDGHYYGKGGVKLLHVARNGEHNNLKIKSV